MNNVGPLQVPPELTQVATGSGKIFKNKTGDFIHSGGFFGSWGLTRASEKDVRELVDRVRNPKEGALNPRIAAIVAQTLDIFSQDKSLRKAVQELREEETNRCKAALAEIKGRANEGFDEGEVFEILRAREWLYALSNPSAEEQKLIELVDDLGLQVVRQYTAARNAADKVASASENDAVRMAKDVLKKNPTIKKVANWGIIPFFERAADVKKVIQLAENKLSPARPERTKPFSLPKRDETKNFQKLRARFEANRPPPKTRPNTPRAQTAKRSAKPPPRPEITRSISTPLNTAKELQKVLDKLPKTAQPRDLEDVPVYNREPCSARNQAAASALHKAAVWKGKNVLPLAEAQQLTQYIETNKKKLIALAKNSPNQSVFISRGKASTPRSLQISIEDGNPRIDILLKSGLNGKKSKVGILGKGGEKTVKLGLDYNAQRMVASAAIGGQVGGASVENALEEFAFLKTFGVALSFCRYINAKGKDVGHIIMPLASEGEATAEKIAKLPPDERKNFFLSAAAILVRVHELGYVSNDVKPENILLNVDGSGSATALITDHGSTVTAKSPIKHCTPNYKSVEITDGTITRHQADPSQDVWSLGVTIWQLMHAGKFPSWHPERPFNYSRRWEKMQPKTALEKLCKAMTHPDPTKRPTMAEAALALEKADYNL